MRQWETDFWSLCHMNIRMHPAGWLSVPGLRKFSPGRFELSRLAWAWRRPITPAAASL